MSVRVSAQSCSVADLRLKPSLQRLRYVDISRNDFSGKVPEEFGYLMNLRVLKLNDNQLVRALQRLLAGLRSSPPPNEH